MSRLILIQIVWYTDGPCIHKKKLNDFEKNISRQQKTCKISQYAKSYARVLET